MEQDISEIIVREEAEAAHEIIPSLTDDCTAVSIHHSLEESYQAGLQNLPENFVTANRPIVSSTAADNMTTSSVQIHVVCSFMNEPRSLTVFTRLNAAFIFIDAAFN